MIILQKSDFVYPWGTPLAEKSAKQYLGSLISLKKLTLTTSTTKMITPVSKFKTSNTIFT